ncbi:hypothetical protein ACFTZL_39165, partial [Streptomyces sp. NPDC056948]
MSAPEVKALGKLWDGALDAQHAFGDLEGHRPAFLGVHDAVAYRAELSVRVDERVLLYPSTRFVTEPQLVALTGDGARLGE